MKKEATSSIFRIHAHWRIAREKRRGATKTVYYQLRVRHSPIDSLIIQRNFSYLLFKYPPMNRSILEYRANVHIFIENLYESNNRFDCYEIWKCDVLALAERQLLRNTPHSIPSSPRTPWWPIENMANENGFKHLNEEE